jgi:RNA polymerase sigma-70 factor (ECF subfamily)
MRWSSETPLGGAVGARGRAAERSLPVGDRDAMGTLLARHATQLRAIALRYTRDPDNAADVVQNAMEKILRNGHQFRGGAKVSTWMYRVVANEALMWLRAERRRDTRLVAGETGNVDCASDPAPSPAEWAERHDEVARLHAAITALGSQERDVIENCGLRGQSYAEWGRTRRLHPAAAKSRAFRARQHLHELLT